MQLGGVHGRNWTLKAGRLNTSWCKQWLVCTGNGDSVYSRLMAAVGRADMGAQSAQYATNAKRCVHGRSSESPAALMYFALSLQHMHLLRSR